MAKKNKKLDRLGDFDTSKMLSGNRSYMSLVYGIITVIVIFVIIFLGVRAISQRDAEVTDEAMQTEQETTYVVAEGDNLWTIAEDIYDDGFKWSIIAEANNLESPDDIETGMELVIPELAPALAAETVGEEVMEEAAEEEVVEVKEEAMEEESSVVASEAPVAEPSSEGKGGTGANAISGNSYTVVEGDHLWGIAVRAYGDGFRWVDIANANSVANPDLIFPGDQFTLPR